MRAITGQDNAVLNAACGHSVSVRVWMWDGSAYQNVAALVDRNWLVAVEWDEGVDEPCAQATVTLRRRLEDYSLNPLVSNRLTGLLALGRPFYIEAATLPLGDPPEASDYREVFRGKVETLAMDKDPLTFTGRDLAGDLSRAYIEANPDVEYGSDPGVAVETIIQSILTAAGTGVTLYVRNALGGTTTGAVFGKFKQKKASVLTAVRELALKIGWDLRYVWHDASSTWRFTLIQPDRTTTTSLWTFQPSKVKAVTKLSQTLFDVRNAIRLYYFDRNVLVGGKASLQSVTAEDATSITNYGRQYMQWAESEDSPIDSASEAQVMANAARDDLKNPLLEFGVDVGFFYPVQLGDLVTFAADDLHFSSNQTLAVVAFRHRIDAKGHRTSLSLRGNAVAANDAWLVRDGRVRLLSNPPAANPEPVTGLTATATAGGAVIKFAASTTPPLAVEYELHISTTSGFTPSDSTRVALSSTTSFTRNDLTPGTTYYAQVVARDRVGNRSTAVQVSFVPRYVEPRTLQPRIAYGVLPPNSDFEARNDAAQPPDAWTVAAGIWGTTVVASTDSFSGGASIKCTAGAASTVLSQLMSIRPDTTYCVRAYVKATGSSTSIGSLGIRWYATVGGSGTLYSETFNATSNVWTEVRVFDTAPSTARYAEVLIIASSLSAVDVYIDSVECLPTSIPQRPWRLVGPGVGGGFAVAFENSWTSWGGAFETVGFRINTLGNLELKGLAKAPTPAPAGYANVFTLSLGYRPAVKKLFRVNTSAGATDIEIEPGGAVKVQAITAGAYLPLDGLSFPMA